MRVRTTEWRGCAGGPAAVGECGKSADAATAREERASRPSRPGGGGDVEPVEFGPAECAAGHVSRRNAHDACQSALRAVALDHATAPYRDPHAAFSVDGQAVRHDFA